jgi:branched-chain amino acid aminotransferase
MSQDRIVFLNGDFIPWENANVHIMSHSFGRGSAIFEVLSFHNPDGRAVFRLDEHIDRLFNTARLLSMEIPFTREACLESVKETVKKNRINEGFIKIICFYAQESFGILPTQQKCDMAIFVVDPLPNSQGEVSACLSKWRKLDPQTVPVEAKAAANYLNGMMARIDSKERDYEQAIMLDTQGFVAEGGTESVFIVKNDQLLTPAPGTILRSITRKTILEIAAANDIATFEKRLPEQCLFEADEILLTGTPFKVLPIKRFEDRLLPGAAGPMAKRLNRLLDNITSGRTEQFKNWLFPVT